MNKGKQGEGQMAVLLGKIQQVEEHFEFTKPTFTNASDNGLDFELLAPHNMAEKVGAIISGKNKIPVSSKKQIKVRVDHKNYDGKITKPVAEKFIDDCKKNSGDAEHLLTGGKGLTSGAKKCMEEAKDVVRYYPQEDLDKVERYYDAQLLAIRCPNNVLREKERVEITRRPQQNERT